MQTRHVVSFAMLAIIGCSVTKSDAPVTSGPQGAVVTPDPSTLPADVQALLKQFPARVSDGTSNRMIGDETSTQPRARMRTLATKLKAEAPKVDWNVRTGSAVTATPASWSQWFSASPNDKIAFGVSKHGAAKGIPTGTGATDVQQYVSAAAGAGIVVLANIYQTTPTLVGYDATVAGTDTFGNAGMLLTYPSSGVQLYALSDQGNLYCFDVPDGVPATATQLTSCASFGSAGKYAAGHNVSTSSPWGIFATGGVYSKIYFGDDSGLLHCVDAVAGTTCWSGHTGAKLVTNTPLSAKELGPPLVLENEPSGQNTIFIGDVAGRFFRVNDDGSGTFAGTSLVAESDVCGVIDGCYASANGTANVYAINGSAGGDGTYNKLYVAADGQVFEYPLLVTASWPTTPSAKTLVTTSNSGVPNASIHSSVALDQTGWMYVGWDNKVQKVGYPFSGSSTAKVYATATQEVGATQSSPTTTPLPFNGQIYVATGGTGTSPTASGGLGERYDCDGTSDTIPLAFEGETTTTYGTLAAGSMINDWENGNVYFGFTSSTGGGLVQYPPTSSDWVCPGTEVSSSACSSGSGTTCAAVNTCPTSDSSCSTNNCTVTGCSGSSCTASCNTGYANCDGNLGGNCCETNIGSDTANCGGCGSACSTNNDTPTCTSGACGGTCATNYADCNGDLSTVGGNGCETGVSCTSCCGTACGVGQACVNGACSGTGNTVCGSAAQGQSLTLACPSGAVISGVSYVSWGTPTGSCATGFTNGSCDDAAGASGGEKELQLVEDICLGQSSCTVQAVAGSATATQDSKVANGYFGDPCTNSTKLLDVQVTCSCSAQCFDGSKDGTESDVDCGGSCPSKCAVGKDCGTSTDCVSGAACVNGICEKSCTLDSDCGTTAALKDCQCGESSGACIGNTGTCGGRIQHFTANGSFVVPASDCAAVYVEAWGGGGAGGTGGTGGGGGFVDAVIAGIQANDTITVTTGKHGSSSTGSGAGGAGGAAGGAGDGDGTNNVGGGGGMTEVIINGAAVFAGGGGGAGDVSGAAGGAGGGTTGGNGSTPNAAVCSAGGGGSNAAQGTVGTTGGGNPGGGGGAVETGGAGSKSTNHKGGGGGGGGFYGGAGGNATETGGVSTCGAGGGGGASNTSNGTSSFPTYTSTVIHNVQASGQTPDNPTASDYATFCTANGVGGNGGNAGSGAGESGCVIIRCE